MTENILEELEGIIIGKLLGEGIHRCVYDFLPDPTKVIKVAKLEEGRGMNLQEYKLWQDFQGTPLVKWFAPVHDVSAAGKYLIQDKLESLPKEKYPKKIPAFFQDTKYKNFGWHPKLKFVCCDYGAFNIWRGVTQKMVKANWWE